MSQPSSLPAPETSWKQELNQRLAAHKNRKGLSIERPESAPSHRYGADSPAARAAARVAERYAKAPSFGEMLAEEARAAVRAAEEASEAAHKAQSAAESVLAGIEAAANHGQLSLEPLPDPEREALAKAAEPEIAANPPAEPTAAPVKKETVATKAPTEADHAPVLLEADQSEVKVVEPDLPIHANLIEFPRELVATRKIRPRLLDGPGAGSRIPSRQLSIFEVDPEAISIEPVALNAAEAPAVPIWSDLKLKAQPEAELEPESDAAPRIHLAQMNRRALAAVVDCSLIAGLLVAAAMLAADHIQPQIPLRQIELAAAAGLALIAVLYQLLSFALGEATPGMKYARIALCTFDDEQPTARQLRGRLGALLLSLVPMGLGVVWILFDDDHLSWHDRLSRTYQREC